MALPARFLSDTTWNVVCNTLCAKFTAYCLLPMMSFYYRRTTMHFMRRSQPPGESEPWQPRADIYCCPRGCIVKFELAGIRPEDVRVEVRDHQLVISGIRRDWFVDPSMQCYSMEISYSQFERAVPLPANVSPQRLALEYKEGMLVVHLVEEAEETS